MSVMSIVEISIGILIADSLLAIIKYYLNKHFNVKIEIKKTKKRKIKKGATNG